jgi:hypothetical protein
MKKHFQPYLELISKEEIKENLLNLYRSNVLRGNSLLHENGFSKISIYKCPDTQIQMRLHKWPKGSNDVTIHNHRWDLFSYCISGRLHCQNFKTRKDINNNTYIYQVSDADDNLEKKRTALYPVEVVSSCQYDLMSGGAHFLEYEELHRVEVPEDTFTLFISGPPKRDYSHVIYHEAPSKKRMSLGKERCIQIIEKIY